MGGRLGVQSLRQSGVGTTGGGVAGGKVGSNGAIGHGGDSGGCGDGECGASGEGLSQGKKKKRRKQEPFSGVNASNLISILRYLLASR